MFATDIRWSCLDSLLGTYPTAFTPHTHTHTHTHTHIPSFPPAFLSRALSPRLSVYLFLSLTPNNGWRNVSFHVNWWKHHPLLQTPAPHCHLPISYNKQFLMKVISAAEKAKQNTKSVTHFSPSDVCRRQINLLTNKQVRWNSTCDSEPQITTTRDNDAFSKGVQSSTKCILCSFAYIINFDVHILNSKICCCRATFTIKFFC